VRVQLEPLRGVETVEIAYRTHAARRVRLLANVMRMLAGGG
jgi:hypothetical protein